MRPKGRTRVIEFDVDEVTHLSLDVSPDGRWLLMDMLGQIWRLPTAGGQAQCLTQGSGVALNFDPAYSPDGSTIVFVSDRSGQNNIWLMNANGSQPRAVYLDPTRRFSDPAWAPDGKSLIVVRTDPTPGRGWHRTTSSLWSLPLDGRTPREWLAEKGSHFSAPTFTPDGSSLYYVVAYSTNYGNGLLHAGHRIQRLDVATGERSNVTASGPADLSPEFQHALNDTGYAGLTAGDESATLSPTISPDGKWMAFAREMTGETLKYRDHELAPRTALFLRNLATGKERRLLNEVSKDTTKVNSQYSWRVFPGYAWAPDGRAIFIAFNGKIHRVEVESGRVAVVPFVAHVRREISEQVRGSVAIDDRKVESRFLQWPSSSPDGTKLATVAFGRIWIKTLPSGDIRPLTEDVSPAFQMTPAFSPDGTQVAFTTWDDKARGSLWRIPLQGGHPVRLTAAAGEYLYPSWSPDGTGLLVTAHTQSSPSAATWSIVGPWAALHVSTKTGHVKKLFDLTSLVPVQYTADGRIWYAQQDSPAAAEDLRSPFPNEAALAAHQILRVVTADGRSQEVLRFAARPPVGYAGRGWNYPAVSPDGKWIAYQAGGSIYAVPIDASVLRGVFDPDPNHVPGAVLEVSGPLGGMFHRWRNASTLEYVSGSVYATFDVATRRNTWVDINIDVGRDVPKGRISITNARIITLSGNRVIQKGDIVIDDSRITCVGTCSVEGSNRVIDATGKFVIPALIDVHAHQVDPWAGSVMRYQSRLMRELAYGVTTIVDPSVMSPVAFPLAEAVEAGGVVGPRVFSSAEVVMDQSHATGDALNMGSQTIAERHVMRRVRWGAITMKNYRLGSRQQNQWLIEAARTYGSTVTAEGGPLLMDLGFAMDGQTGWEHAIGQLPLYADVTQFFGRAHVHYSPTAIVAGHVAGSKEYFRPRQHLSEDPKYLGFLSPAERSALGSSREEAPLSRFSFPIIAEGLADIVRAGGFGALGEHGEQPGIGTHWELWAYAQALPLLEALRLGTIDGAHFVGLDHELGSIETGKIADLIILNSDPLQNIRNSTDIAYVMKAGHLYDATSLERLW